MPRMSGGDTLLPPTGADGFPTAFFVNRMKSLHDGMEKVQEAISRGELMCELCHSNKAMAFCRNCVQYICDFCRAGHRRMKTFWSYIHWRITRKVVFRPEGKILRQCLLLVTPMMPFCVHNGKILRDVGWRMLALCS